jgi:hypothetical protein
VTAGLDDFVWTTYSLFDAFFDNRLSVDHHYKQRRRGFAQDPLLRGLRDANRPTYSRKLYFVKAVQSCLSLVFKEWRTLVRQLEKEIKRYLGNFCALLDAFQSSNPPL